MYRKHLEFMLRKGAVKSEDSALGPKQNHRNQDTDIAWMQG
jgi:hypothetical protein